MFNVFTDVLCVHKPFPIIYIILISSPQKCKEKEFYCIKNHTYHYTTPCQAVICDSDGVTGTPYRTERSNNFLNKLLAIFLILIYKGSS
jgi:hypothetical protein